MIETCKKFGIPQNKILEECMEKNELTQEKAQEYMAECGE